MHGALFQAELVASAKKQEALRGRLNKELKDKGVNSKNRRRIDRALGQSPRPSLADRLDQLLKLGNGIEIQQEPPQWWEADDDGSWPSWIATARNDISHGNAVIQKVSARWYRDQNKVLQGVIEHSLLLELGFSEGHATSATRRRARERH